MNVGFLEMRPKIQPNFSGKSEIRMGSPFNVADLELLQLAGNWMPDLPPYDWQDICAHSKDGNILGLIRWDTEDNEPGFHLVMIDAKRKTVEETERIMGCCESLEWVTSGFKVTILRHIKPNQASEVTARKLAEPQG